MTRNPLPTKPGTASRFETGDRQGFPGKYLSYMVQRAQGDAIMAQSKRVRQVDVRVASLAQGGIVVVTEDARRVAVA